MGSRGVNAEYMGAFKPCATAPSAVTPKESRRVLGDLSRVPTSTWRNTWLEPVSSMMKLEIFNRRKASSLEEVVTTDSTMSVRTLVSMTTCPPRKHPTRVVKRSTSSTETKPRKPFWRTQHPTSTVDALRPTLLSAAGTVTDNISTTTVGATKTIVSRETLE